MLSIIFHQKNYLFLVKLVRNAVKSAFTFNGLGLAFHGKCSWSFGNDIARNVLIFVAEKSKKKKIVIGEGRTDGINGGINENTVAAKKNDINFSKVKTKCSSSLHYNGDESYMYVNKTEICKFKANDIISWYNICLGSISKSFAKDKQSEIFLNDTMIFHLTKVQLKRRHFYYSPIFIG